jgi:tetraacyldisaccharide 4'-kinase
MRHALGNILTSRQNGFAAACVRGALTLPEFAYRALSGYRRQAYLSGRRTRVRLPCPVISVGNLTTGGTGKTPMTQWLARRLQERGARVAVVLRGYRGGQSDAGGVVSDGERILMTVDESGDEAQLHARTLKGVPILIGRDRAAVGRRAVEEFGAEIIVLDDGFQTWWLERDLDILLVDATNPFGNGHLLPCGVLREPIGAAARADVVMLTKSDRVDAETLARLESRLREWLRGDAAIAHAQHKPTGFLNGAGETLPLHHLQGERVHALSALADNASFFNALNDLGLIVESATGLPDHHRYTERDWQAISHGNYQAVVTTEKDWVKLDPAWLTPQTYALRIETDVTRGEAELLQRVYEVWACGRVGVWEKKNNSYTPIQTGCGWQPDVSLVTVNGRRAVLKDYSRRAPLVRLVGAFLLRREQEAYRRLSDVAGVPKSFGLQGRCGLLTEFIEAELVTKFVETKTLPPIYFERLRALIDALHAAGVAHGDLKRRKNLMITANHQPYLIDFASAWWQGGRWNVLRNWLFRQMCQIDRNALAKLKRRHAPDLLTEEERAGLEHPTGLERWARRLLGR